MVTPDICLTQDKPAGGVAAQNGFGCNHAPRKWGQGSSMITLDPKDNRLTPRAGTIAAVALLFR